MAKRRRSALGDMINTGVGNLVGVGLIGSTASMVSALPAGTTKTIAGQIPAFQSTALLGENIGYAKRSLGMGEPRRSRSKKSKSKGMYY